MTRHRLQTWLGGAMLAALTWTVLVWATGGFVWETWLVRFSSREPLRPLGLAVLCGVAWWAVAPQRAATTVGRAVRWLKEKGLTGTP